jgi:hypothetical protein
MVVTAAAQAQKAADFILNRNAPASARGARAMRGRHVILDHVQSDG